ncbi:MAG: hypothetical protein ACJ757_04725 [Gaiellaceae bacterium]
MNRRAVAFAIIVVLAVFIVAFVMAMRGGGRAHNKTGALVGAQR